MNKNIYLFSISSHPHATSINSLDIKFLKPTIDLSDYDYFIITSKQTSEALKQYDKSKLKPALCVSVATATSYMNIGGEVLGVGSGYGDNLITKIKEYPKNTKWLYLRAKVVASSLISTCHDNGYDVDEVVVYESECSKKLWHVEVEDEATLIFTSPSSVECFLKNHIISPHAIVIVIGKTTAKALPENVKYTLSNETTIDSCIKIAQNNF